jgi:hypothetical protein
MRKKMRFDYSKTDIEKALDWWKKNKNHSWVKPNSSRASTIKENRTIFKLFDSKYPGMFFNAVELIRVENIENLDKLFCRVCGKRLKNILRQVCSYKCLSRYHDRVLKIKQTKLARYGNENYNNSKSISKTRKSWSSEFKSIMYGTQYATKLKNRPDDPVNAAKTKQTKLARYGSENYNNQEKTKKTNFNRYGVFSTFQAPNTLKKLYSEQTRRKLKQTWINKDKTPFLKKMSIKTKQLWNGRTPEQRLDFSKKLSQAWANRTNEQKQQIQAKIYESKKRNGTFGKSKAELEILTQLKQKFGQVEYQYKDNRYPYSCDFYIPEKDLFIEYQGNWMHGGKPFDDSSDDDLRRVSDWERRSEQINFKGQPKNAYLAAINTWYFRDVIKRQTALKNNINYKEFFTKQEFDKWLVTQ